MKVDGGCLCGHISYEAEIDAEKVAVCHCTDCQMNSGTAFGFVAHIVDGNFMLLSGTLKEFEKIAESGRVRKLSFCPECGTRIHARTDGDPTAFFGLRAGTIRQRRELKPKIQVWSRSALPWVSELSSIPERET